MIKTLFLTLVFLSSFTLAFSQTLRGRSEPINVNIPISTDNSATDIKIPTTVKMIDPEQIVKGTYYALIIGVKDYEDPEVKDLANPVNDANKLKQVLTTGYNFEPQNVTYLPNPTRREVYKSLEGFKNKLQENDVWLIFFAGHGFWDKNYGDGEGYWMLKDAYKDDRSSWFSNTDLRNYISSAKSLHTLIIADACFSGALVRDENFKEKEDFMREASKDIQTAYKDKSRKAMTSGALEAVPDKSVFFKYFIKVLEENTKPYLRALTLFVEVDKYVRVNGGKPIFEPIYKVGHEFGDFVFIRKR